MSLRVIFKPSARLEFEEAVAWYELQRPGLGKEFKLEVKSAIEHARETPGRFQRIRGRAQKIRLRRFKKYAIYFAIKEGTLAVLAVFHGSRDPVLHRQRLA